MVGDANSVRKKPGARPRKAPVSAVPHDKAVALAACRQPGGCRRIPYIGSERKNSVRKTGERYKHREEKSGSVALRPVEKNSAPLPHMAHSNRILVLKHEFLANE